MAPDIKTIPQPNRLNVEPESGLVVDYFNHYGFTAENAQIALKYLAEVSDDSLNSIGIIPLDQLSEEHLTQLMNSVIDMLQLARNNQLDTREAQTQFMFALDLVGYAFQDPEMRNMYATDYCESIEHIHSMKDGDVTNKALDISFLLFQYEDTYELSTLTATNLFLNTDIGQSLDISDLLFRYIGADDNHFLTNNLFNGMAVISSATNNCYITLSAIEFAGTAIDVDQSLSKLIIDHITTMILPEEIDIEEWDDMHIFLAYIYNSPPAIKVQVTNWLTSNGYDYDSLLKYAQMYLEDEEVDDDFCQVPPEDFDF